MHKGPATLRILVIDDVPAMRLILRDMLEQLGYLRVTEAEDAESAWALLQESALSENTAFQLVIADWNMPGVSGVELLRSIRGSPHFRNIPFLMVTAKGDRNHIAEASDAGVTEYVVKPFHRDALGETITRVIGKP